MTSCGVAYYKKYTGLYLIYNATSAKVSCMNISHAKKSYVLVLMLVMMLNPILGLAATAWPLVGEQVSISKNMTNEGSESCHERETQTQVPAQDCCEELCLCDMGTCHAPVATSDVGQLVLITKGSDITLPYSFYSNPSLSSFTPPPIH